MKQNKHVLKEESFSISALFLCLVKPIPLHEAVFWLNKMNEAVFYRIEDKLLKTNNINAIKYAFASYECPMPTFKEQLILVSNRSFSETSESQSQQLFLKDQTVKSLLPQKKIFDFIIYATNFKKEMLSTINIPNSIFFSYLVDTTDEFKTLQKFILQNE